MNPTIGRHVMTSIQAIVLSGFLFSNTNAMTAVSMANTYKM